jgi:hypothetical protein
MAKNQIASATKNPAASTSMRTHLGPLSTAGKALAFWESGAGDQRGIAWSVGVVS